MNVNRHLKYEMQMWENAKQRNSTNNNVNKYKREKVSYFQKQVVFSHS